MAADEGLGDMWTDNYGPWDSFGIPPVQRAFGDWSVARFRDYLSAEFTTSQLAAMWISNVSMLDIRTELKSTATGWGRNGSVLYAPVWNDSRWLDQVLWRGYKIFKRQSGTEALANYYEAVKSAVLQAGNSEFLVCGNDIPVISLGWVRGDLDMVSTEVNASANLAAS